MRLTIQAAQHDQAIAALKREIQSLQTESRQDERIQELEGKIGYMDALMRSKTQEIEENDDRFIEYVPQTIFICCVHVTTRRLHKEKKKLTAKVETLSRKVQTLQTKLATLKDGAANQDLTQPASTSKRSSASLKQTLAGTAAQHTRSSTTVPPSSPSRSRSMSSSSALVSHKTPEGRRAPPVFRAKSPEPAKVIPPEPQDPLPAAVVIGKKRAAPEEGDEAVPVQVFTSEGVLVKEHHTPTTPRRRKSPRTGFTPVRNTTARPLTSLAAQGSTSQPPGSIPPVISDVTNSPRSQPPADAKIKRSWLGASVSKPSQQSSGGATARVISTRPGATERGR